jgi:hypothetical protein
VGAILYEQNGRHLHGTRCWGELETIQAQRITERLHIFLSFQEDALGIELRSHIGIENLLWASDYPHAESTFPRSREIVDRILQGIPEAELVQIAGANTARLDRFSTEKMPLHTGPGASL